MWDVFGISMKTNSKHTDLPVHRALKIQVALKFEAENSRCRAIRLYSHHIQIQQMTKIKLGLFVLGLFLFSACSPKYVTPGSSVNISELADEDIAAILSNKPAAEFPVNMAIARIQSPKYTNWRYRRPMYHQPQGGQFSMVLTRDSEEESAFEQLNSLDGIKQASPFNRLLLPYNYRSIKDLRMAAAKMKAEMLLVYTFDTEFIVETKNYGPQHVFTLGYLKNKNVKVVTTASAAIFDVQTEYLYGLAEATAKDNRKANAWKKQDEVDALRIKTEKEAFNALVKDIEEVWTDIRDEYANR